MPPTHTSNSGYIDPSVLCKRSSNEPIVVLSDTDFEEDDTDDESSQRNCVQSRHIGKSLSDGMLPSVNAIAASTRKAQQVNDSPLESPSKRSKYDLAGSVTWPKVAAFKPYTHSGDRDVESPEIDLDRATGFPPITSTIRSPCIWSNVGDATDSYLEHPVTERERPHSIETLQESQDSSGTSQAHMTRQKFTLRQDSTDVALADYKAYHADVDLHYPIDPLLEGQLSPCGETRQPQLRARSEVHRNHTNESEECHDERLRNAWTDTELYAPAAQDITRGIKKANMAAISRSDKVTSKRNIASRKTYKGRRPYLESYPLSPSPTNESTSSTSNTSSVGVSDPSVSHAATGNGRQNAIAIESLLKGSFVSKRVIVEGIGIFRLEFERTLCASHQQGGVTKGDSQSIKPRKARFQTRKNRSVGGRFTRGEDDLLLKLRRHKNLSWSETHREFNEIYRGRSQGSLQVHYSTKLKDYE